MSQTNNTNNMNNMNNIKKLVFAALCVAIAIALPQAFHAIPNAGRIFLPMHIPVLLCGFICGPLYGLVCGILAPFLSSQITGMPPAPVLPGMICELAIYGLLTGLLIQLIRSKSQVLNVYMSLILSMLAGRVAYGILNSLVFQAGKYSLQAWLSAAFVTAIPGIIAQLIIIPLLLFALQKAKLLQLPGKAAA